MTLLVKNSGNSPPFLTLVFTAAAGKFGTLFAIAETKFKLAVLLLKEGTQNLVDATRLNLANKEAQNMGWQKEKKGKQPNILVGPACTKGATTLTLGFLKTMGAEEFLFASDGKIFKTFLLTWVLSQRQNIALTASITTAITSLIIADGLPVLSK